MMFESKPIFVVTYFFFNVLRNVSASPDVDSLPPSKNRKHDDNSHRWGCSDKILIRQSLLKLIISLFLLAKPEFISD